MNILEDTLFVKIVCNRIAIYQKKTRRSAAFWWTTMNLIHHLFR